MLTRLLLSLTHLWGICLHPVPAFKPSQAGTSYDMCFLLCVSEHTADEPNHLAKRNLCDLLDQHTEIK